MQSHTKTWILILYPGWHDVIFQKWERYSGAVHFQNETNNNLELWCPSLFCFLFLLSPWSWFFSTPTIFEELVNASEKKINMLLIDFFYQSWIDSLTNFNVFSFFNSKIIEELRQKEGKEKGNQPYLIGNVREWKW